MLEVSLGGAFFGGVLTLLSPCSALLLPAFFAYAFKSRRQLFFHTGIFFLGLATVFIPLGMGASLVSSLVLDQRDTLINVAGGLLILFGLLEITGKGFALLPGSWANRQAGSGLTSVYVTGLVYGFAGLCSGPLLGAVLTLAASADTAVAGGGMLLVYALGIAAPLFVVSAMWDRYKLGEWKWLRGRPLKIGPFSIHTMNLVSGLLFLVLGAAFILSGGAAAFEAFYQRLGFVDLSWRAQQAVSALAGLLPNWAWFGLIVLCGVLLIRWRGRHGTSSS